MNLRLFVSCWGNEVDLAGAVALAREWQADGVEGPPPHGQQAEVLRASGLPWIAEVATGGGYVPRPHLTPAQHLDDLRRLIEASLPLSPVLVNALAGSDAWPFRYQVLFFEQAMDMGRELGVQLAIETHRSHFTLLTAIVVAGGLARLVMAMRLGVWAPTVTLPLGMELLVTPALWLWQGRVARIFTGA